MPASSDRIDFSPPHEPGVTRAFVLAVIAHLLLMAALTWGIRWNRDVENLSAEAELWSATPQQAAPKLVETPTPPPPPPPPPEPRQRMETPPPPPVVTPKAPDIAVEREKKRQELARERQEELERQKKIEVRKKQEELKREELAAKKEADERKHREDEQKQAKLRKQQQQEAQKQQEARRDEQIKRAQGLANATGGPTSTGTALRSSGPSASYAGRIAARIKPNIVFTDVISGNPAAEVEIRVAPDGTIVGKRLLESSGVKSWDDAVLRAIDKTEILPRDTDGTVVPKFPIRFRPRD